MKQMIGLLRITVNP